MFFGFGGKEISAPTSSEDGQLRIYLRQINLGSCTGSAVGTQAP